MNIMSRTLFGKRFFDSKGKAMPDLEGLKEVFVRLTHAVGTNSLSELLPWIRLFTNAHLQLVLKRVCGHPALGFW